MEKTIIIYYLIGLLVAYFAVGISNKVTKEPLTSWWILTSWLVVSSFCFLFICWNIYKIFEFVYNLSSKLLIFLHHVPYRKILIGLFKFIKKTPLVFKWIFNIFKKLHFILIPPEKGIDLIINLFVGIGKWLNELWYAEIILYIFAILMVIGFTLLIIGNFFGMYIILFAVIILVLGAVIILNDGDF